MYISYELVCCSPPLHYPKERELVSEIHRSSPTFRVPQKPPKSSLYMKLGGGIGTFSCFIIDSVGLQLYQQYHRFMMQDLEAKGVFFFPTIVHPACIARFSISLLIWSVIRRAHELRTVALDGEFRVAAEFDSGFRGKWGGKVWKQCICYGMPTNPPWMIDL